MGSDRFAKITQRYRGRNLAIVLDNKIQSAPVIREAITGGEASISGLFTTEEASDLAWYCARGRCLRRSVSVKNVPSEPVLAKIPFARV